MYIYIDSVGNLYIYLYMHIYIQTGLLTSIYIYMCACVNGGCLVSDSVPVPQIDILSTPIVYDDFVYLGVWSHRIVLVK